MALTYGFYNSVEGDRVYDAIQFGQIFDGIITDGVYATYEKAMNVIASENAGEVIIQPGRAWFNHTWNYNDANLIFEAPAPEVLLERIDALVLEINSELSSRTNSYKWVQGTPSSRPERPTLTNTTTVHQYPLCYIHRYPETTMIYTRDITNMIGTSECPFVTGVLKGIDLDAWIKQWDDEFHNWETTTKTAFEAWMLNQESVYTAWADAIKSQMAGDVEDIEAWIETIKDIIDSETATHLQNEIDDLKKEITSGSHIFISTINQELYGRNVTITTEEGIEYTERFNDSGVAEFKSIPYVGNLTVTSSYGTKTAEAVIYTPYFARYTFQIAFWAATINIVGIHEYAGQTVTIKDSNLAVVGTVILDSDGLGVYTANRPDTYTFTLIYGGETMEVTLSVTQETTYTVEIHGGSLTLQDWLTAGSTTAHPINPSSYSTFADVEADEEVVRQLMTVHDAVDYLATSDGTDELIGQIINSDICAKWINLRDYALDTLSANSDIKALMDTADKYGYGEWVVTDSTTTPPTWGPKGNVPIMTSNTAPYGEAGSNDTRFGSYTWQAFDGSDTTNLTVNWGLTNYIINYKFIKPVNIRRFKVWYRSDGSTHTFSSSYDLIGSNDGSTWEVIESFNEDIRTERIHDVSNNNYYLYYGLRFSSTGTSGGYISTLQFYGRELSVSVPTMTSNTAPYGEVSASSSYDSNRTPFKAFDGNSTTSWATSGSNVSGWLQYQFTNPVIVKQVFIKPYNASGDYCRMKNFAIKASNDGVNFETLYSGVWNSADAEKVIDIHNDDAHSYYRLDITDTYYVNHNAMITTLNFYGLDYSEREFAQGSTMKYIYDHGVELETIMISGTGTKGTDAIQLTAANAQASATIDTTDYGLMRGKVGAHASGTNQLLCGSGSSNFTASNMPNNNGLDISSINGSNAVGVKQTAGGVFDATEIWLE